MSFHISQPSIQSLYIELSSNGHVLSNGTAFVVQSVNRKHFLVTARHNVTGRHQDTCALLSTKTGAIPDLMTVWHNSARSVGEFVKREIALLIDDKRQWFEHPVKGDEKDFVAFRIEETEEVRLYPYRLDSFTHLKIKPAEMVSVIGFPFGERTAQSLAIWATGFVASEPEIDHGGRPVFLIDCRARKGQSGSPVVRYRDGGGRIHHDDGSVVDGPFSEVLGLYSGRINVESDIGVVWKAYALAELVEWASTR